MEPLLFFETHWLHEHHLVVVCYTWFVMAMLALFSFLATRRMNILPGEVPERHGGRSSRGSTTCSSKRWDRRGGSFSR